MITNLTKVKILAEIPTIVGEGVPTVTGAAGDVYLDTITGLTYDWTGSAWVADTSGDIKINMAIRKAEQDYLKIRGIPFEIDDEEIVYPESADYTAAEMVCYLLGIGDYEGRGKGSESIGGRAVTFDQKMFGYPVSIIGTIDRYAVVK